MSGTIRKIRIPSDKWSNEVNFMTDKNKQLYIDFEAYERVAEPHKRERASVWRTAIGLQDVDGLKMSEYLKETQTLV